ncbi:MAG TPA: hypothetical protein PLA24_03795 [Tenuifilaceae bacterium]|nr:hypothetical protein [Tenuifilaceae bacterium]
MKKATAFLLAIKSMPKYVDFSKLAIVLIAGFVFFINFNTKPWNCGRVIHDDMVSYYCYLPAIVIHHDWHFAFAKDNPEFYADKYWPVKTPDGKETVKMTMGLSILYLPFFLIGHLFALAGNFPANGYSLPYLIAIQFSALFYLIIALIVLRRLLAKWFSINVVGMVLLATYFGTNMPHYSTLEATMSHTYSFFLFALFFELTVKFWNSPKTKYWIFLGLLLGLVSLVRPSNAIILLFFMLWGIDSNAAFGKRITFFLKKWKLILLTAVFFLIVWLPQLIYWHTSTGHWFYYSYSKEGFFFSNPHIIDGLFSYRKGWLTYSPVMFFPLAGIILMIIKRKLSWFWAITPFFVINLYIIFSWWCWWYGGGLGARPLIESYAILTLPFCVVITEMNKKGWSKILGNALITILLAYGLFTNFQYRYGSIHWDAMNKEAYWDSFMRLKPSTRFYSLLQTPDYESALQGKKEIHTDNR